MPTTPDINQLPPDMDRRLWAAYYEEENGDIPRRRFVSPVARTYGGPSLLAAGKFLQYLVIAPPDADVSVGKFVQYLVIGPPDADVDVGKFVQYVVIENKPVAPLPPRLQRHMIDGADGPDTGYEDVPNLNLRRRVQTPFGSYFLPAVPQTTPPSNQLQTLREPVEDYPVNLNLAVRRVTEPGAFIPAPVYSPERDPYRRMLDAGFMDELEPNLNIRARLFTSPEAYQYVQQPNSDMSIAVRRNLSIYQEEEDAAQYQRRSVQRAIAGAGTPQPDPFFSNLVYLAQRNRFVIADEDDDVVYMQRLREVSTRAMSGEIIISSALSFFPLVIMA